MKSPKQEERQDKEDQDGFFDDDPSYPDSTKFITPKVIKQWDFYLSEEMQLPPAYVEMCHDLRRNIAAQDTVTITLNNFGGSCHGLISIVNAIKACPAKVHMVVAAPCYSAGASLALAGSSLSMEHNTFLMFHNYSGGSSGKGEDIVDDAMHHRKWIYRYFRDLHMPFLSEKECARIESNRDVYVHSHDKDLNSRLRRHFGRKK